MKDGDKLIKAVEQRERLRRIASAMIKEQEIRSVLPGFTLLIVGVTPGRLN